VPAGGRRRWGFHQLADSFAQQLVDSAGVTPGDLVLDVGAGTGALTAPLLAAGARVVAIELHPDRLAALRRRFDVDSTGGSGRFDVESTSSGARSAVGRVQVVRADAGDLRLPRQPFKVIANPPWSITIALLRRLTAPGSRLLRADLVVPRHVATRWASPDAPGAGRWHRTFAVEVADVVPRWAFQPPPPQPAVLLTLRRRGGT
jgi:23S rRNA (adenine-N6)-dimethyltransferase